LTEYFHTYLPGLEIYWSEFAFDSNKKSPFGVPILDSAKSVLVRFPQNSWQLQGSLMLRSFFEAITVPYIDKMLYFEMHNETQFSELPEKYMDKEGNRSDFYDTYTHAIQFQTSGIVQGMYSKAGAFSKKTGWYMFNNATEVMKGCKFKADSSKEDYRDYVFSCTDGKSVRVLYKPTQNGSQISRVINFGKSDATIRDLEATTKVEKQISLSAGKAIVDINEMPKIIYSRNALAAGVVSKKVLINGKLRELPLVIDK
jgi:hypothetical protein